MSSRQAEFRRLMKAERERKKKMEDTSEKDRPVAEADGPRKTIAPPSLKPRGILRSPKQSKSGTTQRGGSASSDEEIGNGAGRALGGLLDDYGSDSDGDDDNAGDNESAKALPQNETINGVENSVPLVGPSKPKITFAPDVKMDLPVVPAAELDRSILKVDDVEDAASEVHSAGSPLENEVDARNGADTVKEGGYKDDGVDEDAWREFQELVGNDENRDSNDVAVSHSVRDDSRASSADVDNFRESGEATTSETKLMPAPKSKSKKGKKSTLDPFVASARSEAVEQAAYEARLARLMLLRTRASNKRERQHEGSVEWGASARQDNDAADAVNYAPALAFQEEDVAMVDTMDTDGNDTGAAASSSSSSIVGGTTMAKAESGVKKKARVESGDKDIAKAETKRKESSSLAAEILRRKRERARKIARATDDEGLEW